jgi:hypothetical protein
VYAVNYNQGEIPGIKVKVKGTVHPRTGHEDPEME